MIYLLILKYLLIKNQPPVAVHRRLFFMMSAIFSGNAGSSSAGTPAADPAAWWKGPLPGSTAYHTAEGSPGRSLQWIFLGKAIGNDGTPTAGTESDHLRFSLFRLFYFLRQIRNVGVTTARPYILFEVCVTKKTKFRPSGNSRFRFLAASHSGSCPFPETDAP